MPAGMGALRVLSDAERNLLLLYRRAGAQQVLIELGKSLGLRTIADVDARFNEIKSKVEAEAARQNGGAEVSESVADGKADAEEREARGDAELERLVEERTEHLRELLALSRGTVEAVTVQRDEARQEISTLQHELTATQDAKRELEQENLRYREDEESLPAERSTLLAQIETYEARQREQSHAWAMLVEAAWPEGRPEDDDQPLAMAIAARLAAQKDPVMERVLMAHIEAIERLKRAAWPQGTAGEGEELLALMEQRLSATDGEVMAALTRANEQLELIEQELPPWEDSPVPPPLHERIAMLVEAPRVTHTPALTVAAYIGLLCEVARNREEHIVVRERTFQRLERILCDGGLTTGATDGSLAATI